MAAVNREAAVKNRLALDVMTMKRSIRHHLWAATLATLSASQLVIAQEEQTVPKPDSKPESGLLKGAPDLIAPLPRTTPPIENGTAMVVDWAMVLDLARASSLEIQIAGEKVNEANVQHQLSRLAWIPSLKIGTTWYNSQGNQQLIPGQIINANKSNLFAGGLASATIDPRKTCLDILRAKQQYCAKTGELDRVTRAELQKVSNAYIDLVAAQAGAAISSELQQLMGDLVERSRLLLQQGLLTEVNVLGKEQELQNSLQNSSEALAGHHAASAQLVMLLDLEPGTRLVASWDHLAPVTLVDENTPEVELVDRALQQGPGIAEIESVLQAIAEQQQKARQLALLPTFNAQTGYGTFGGSPSSTYLANFGNRFDAQAGAYWDVMEALGTRQTRELFNSKKRQAGLEHAKLRRQLEAGVSIARMRSIEARRRIVLAEKEVDLAIRRYSQSKKRMDADVSPSREIDLSSIEVMPAIGALARARQNYLQAVINYNKAQVELLYLIGANGVNENYQLPNCPPNRYVNGRPVPHTEQAPPAQVAPTTEFASEQTSEQTIQRESLVSPPAPSPQTLDSAEPVSTRQSTPVLPPATLPDSAVPLIPVETVIDDE